MSESSDANREPVYPADCKICLIEHDEAIHAATVNVHQWFRRQVLKNLEYDDNPQARVA